MRIADGETLASAGNMNTECNSFYWRNTDLKRMPDGKLYLYCTGGAAVWKHHPIPVSPGEAVQWIVDKARKPSSDLEYSESEAQGIVYGQVFPTHPLAAFTSEELQQELLRREV